MRLAFYYHISVSVHDGRVYLPSFLGLFVDDLARRVDTFYYLAHSEEYDPRAHDYCLTAKNIEVVNLGAKTNFFSRLLNGKRVIGQRTKDVKCDALLMRSPTPLAPALYEAFKDRCLVTSLIVGDYSTLGAKHFSTSYWGGLLYEWIMNRRVFPKIPVLVNSHSLLEKYQKICPKAFPVRTTTITDKDFFFREDTCQEDTVRLLYVGRYDWQKGFKELFEMMQALVAKGLNFRLHLVGFDSHPQLKYEKEIRKAIKDMGIDEVVVLEGKKSLGEEMNQMYRIADIFVLPSYSEGMPRCIWEAMANGCPVVATKVGGIPHNLRSGQDALLIEPHDTKQLTETVLSLANDGGLRRTIIASGYECAKDTTLEVQNQKIMDHIKSLC